MPIHGYLGGVISATAPTVSVSGASGIFTLEEQMQAAGTWPIAGLYPISRSVRIRASASAYFSRTPASATNRSTWTYSAWIKKSPLDYNQSLTLLSAGSFGSDLFTIQVTDNGSSVPALAVYGQISGSAVLNIAETPARRDPNAWFHVMVVLDTTQATASNRLKLYYNGAQVTALTTATYPNQNTTFAINNNQATAIGARAGGGAPYYDGYMTEINFVDGQALTPTSFGAFDSVTGVWNPIRYTGTYGTNGFYLNFSDNSAATAAALGKDSSGNGNNWTPNNISVTNVTAPNTNDSMVDTPTNYGTDTGAGGEVRGNYAVLSIPASSGWTFSNANMTGYGGTYNCYFSMPIIGKMYFEAYCANTVGGGQVGFVKNATIPLASVGYNQAGYYGVNYATTNSYWVNGSNDATTHGTIVNNTMKFAVDGATGKVWIGSGSTWYGSGDPAAGTNPAFTLSLSDGDLIYPMLTSQQVRDTFTINTGQQPFGNAAPSGFKAMCTQNMTTPSISNGANYMAATTYTGTGSSQAISNAVNSISFQPDLVWIKSRSAATDHKWTDSVRGVTKALVSNSTAAETTDSTGLTAFGSSGFTVGANTTYNNSGATYVGWQWNGGGTAVTNTAGSITSSVSANTTAGFSVVTYTGTIANATVGHGLGVAPKMIIARNRTNIVNWIVYHASLTSASYYLTLDETNGQTNNSIFWQGVAPTSTVFSLGANSSCNGNTSNVAYCFAPIAGYSAFGSYTGNGSTDGPFVYCGFRPKFVLMKIYTSATHWVIIDSSRDPYNVASLRLCPNLALDEATLTDPTCDLVSNGFKIRTTTATSNTSGQSYIYAAFAENPFNISRAR
jgi:hypothetical protein